MVIDPLNVETTPFSVLICMQFELYIDLYVKSILNLKALHSELLTQEAHLCFFNI